MISKIKNKLKAAKFHYTIYKEKSIEFYREAVLKSIINSELRNNKNQVFIGSAFSDLGGVPHHIHSISKRSVQKPLMVPSPEILKKITKWEKQRYFRDLAEQFLRKNPPKLIHTHVDPWFIEIAASGMASHSKWIHTYHTLYFKKDWKDGLETWQEEINHSLTQVASKADVRISISHWLKDYLKRAHNIDTIYIPNGVDVEKCDRADKNRFINKYKLQDFVLFASGISDIKNVGDFLRLANALPHLNFVLIGRGISVEALSKKYNLPIARNLTIIGQMPHHDLMDAIAACRVFVVTSKSEGLPTVLMEAMALEKTVVGCDTFGTKEVIGDDSCGYIYRHDSMEDLIQKTEMAFERQDKGIKARRRILEEYDWRVVIPQIDVLYSKHIK